jgi:hypothetical protein
MKKLISLLLAAVLCITFASIAMADTFGLGIDTSIASSTDATVVDGTAKDGNAQVDSTICAVIIGDDGVIKSITFDIAQTKVSFSAAGLITADKAAVILSKVEKGDAYGMAKVAKAGEWYVQAAAFAAYCVGKTVKDVLATPVYAVDEHHQSVADVADLKTTVTIDIGSFLKSLEKAAANAK